MSKFEQTHPQYDARRDDWRTVNDCYLGETRVKKRTTEYLPMTSGQEALGVGSSGGIKQPGQKLYDAYLMRAVFPELVKHTAHALVGLALREPWTIALPPRLDYLTKRATNAGETLADLIDNVLGQLVRTGRVGLLPDVRENNEIYFAPYAAAAITNWDDTPSEVDSGIRDLRLTVLNESRHERDPSTWSWDLVKRYRSLELIDGVYSTNIEREGAEVGLRVPSVRGQALDRIPFQFINAMDLAPTPSDVPLLGLARIALTAYRGEADHRQALFLQGQDTLVLRGVANPTATGEDEAKVVVGAGAAIYLPDAEQDAKFIGVSGEGLGEMRTALENDYRRGEQYGVSLLTSSSEGEAAETVRTRMSARTASLATIVKTAAQGIEAALRTAAEWDGSDPDAVTVQPNLDFVDDPMAPEALLRFVEAKMRGAPISWATVHDLMRRGDLTQLSLEEELEAIQNEPDTANDPNVGEDGGDGDDDGE